jgi:aconitate decarboxylase
MSHGPGAGNPHTRGIAEFVAALRYEEIPPEVIARIKLLILDSLGCAMFGAGLPWSRILLTTLAGLDTTAACAVWGTGMRRWSTAPWCRASSSTTCTAPACCMWAQ